ncbi:partitioning defective 3 homolog B-like isoform X1 [Stegostoma tigrinum]|uniref:partitioning defective 3 homolog B-like isoform X1 n=2 Tax=Stegostoma tigrinum TaxID=3053191 RepID=UPI0028707DC5|nr:partitioning defective 3 homolog B-like isoform X1 [Stegostoma tigrinum]
MKVTVQFGRTGIVVPCGDGTLTVQQLVRQAVQRYCKNTAKDAGYLIRIHHLEYMDGGILDPDDVLIDVAEDKDKLVAVYEEQETHREDEVANGSLKDRQSPDTFESELAAQLAAFQPITGEIEVTPSALKGSTPLMVRRSSDPAMVPPTLFQPGASQSDEPLNRNLNVKPVTVGANWAPIDDVRTDYTGPTDKHSKHAYSDLTKKVEFSGDSGPLGIHVVPFNSSLSGRFLGLCIRGIEENSRSKRERLLQENECIIKINDNNLMDRTFAQAQEVFRNAMQLPTVQLQIVPNYNRDRYEKSAIGTLTGHSHDDDSKATVPPPLRSKPTSKPTDVVYPNSPETNSLLISPQISSPQHSRSNSHSIMPKKTSSPTSFGGLATKKQGKKIKIDLRKGPEGLGFTVVTRESSVHGPGPILVKNILQRGAAVKDGRLQSGDRILEVNGIDITGKTQEELVAMLRSTKHGETVALVVARQDDVFMPRELKGEQNCNLPGDDKKEYLTYEIPLNDSGSAGLGISLKGNKSKDTGADLGIFIKAILHGGAAFKDGRLRVNDQLIAVNGERLLEKSNHEALETLRRSMSMEGNIRGMIQVMVARRVDRHQEDRLEVGGVQVHSTRSSNDTSQWHTQICSGRERPTIANDEGEAEIPPPVPPHPDEQETMGVYKMWSFREDKSSDRNSASQSLHQRPKAGVAEYQASSSVQRQSPGKISGSKSMDLVADEGNVGSLAMHQSDSTGNDVGPMLGLKKSSSLESLQTAVAEVRKNELPFHRPRPHMVRGRGCNESFRAAIDKSYDGPEIPDDDSEESSQSGHETPGSESALQGNTEHEDVENSDGKTKKEKKKKEKKKKVKTKGKMKDKEKKKENDNQEKKAKKKGFGAMLRFGKKKEEKGKEQKSKQKSDGLNEVELEKMKEERDRIEAKHQELREKQARERYDQLPSTGPSVPDIEDDDMDPNYAKVNHFREPPPSTSVFKAPSPQLHSINPPRDLTTEQENLDGLYAKINKQQPPDSARPTNVERIHQLRKEYQQARREGAIPSYEEHEGRRWPSDYEPGWVQAPVKGPNGRPQFEEVEHHQYATLPRHVPGEPDDYHLQGPYGDRESHKYLGAQHHTAGYRHLGNYPRNAADNRLDPRMPDYLSSARLREAVYNLPTQYKGPHRHDVPPSPTQTYKMPRHHDQGKMTYRENSPDRYRYPYEDGRYQDPRQKNGMTAAV